MRPNQIECCEQAVGDQGSEHATGREGATDARSICQDKFGGKRKDEKAEPQRFGHRRGELLASEPSPAKEEYGDGKQKRRIAKRLEKEVGSVCANRANPVVSRASGWRRGGDIECRILRRVREQTEGQEYGKSDADEADQLVDATVFGWFKYTQVNLPGWGKVQLSMRCAGARARCPCGGTKTG